MMTSQEIEELERALGEARTRTSDAARALQSKHRGGEVQAWRVAHAEQKRLERELGLAKGEEVAIPHPWDPPWDKGAPLPHVMAAGGRVSFLYYVSTPDPEWDGTYVNVIDPSAPQTMPLAIVEVKGCYSHRFGGPNDEVFHGHPLSDRGLEGYGAYTVANSRWIAEHQATNSVHSMYDAKRWEDLEHFFLAFHDDVFECIATGFEIEAVQKTFADALKDMLARLTARR
jgi:hypothetical protein